MVGGWVVAGRAVVGGRIVGGRVVVGGTVTALVDAATTAAVVGRVVLGVVGLASETATPTTSTRPSRQPATMSHRCRYQGRGRPGGGGGGGAAHGWIGGPPPGGGGGWWGGGPQPWLGGCDDMVSPYSISQLFRAGKAGSNSVMCAPLEWSPVSCARAYRGNVRQWADHGLLRRGEQPVRPGRYGPAPCRRPRLHAATARRRDSPQRQLLTGAAQAVSSGHDVVGILSEGDVVADGKIRAPLLLVPRGSAAFASMAAGNQPPSRRPWLAGASNATALMLVGQLRSPSLASCSTSQTPPTPSSARTRRTDQPSSTTRASR